MLALIRQLAALHAQLPKPPPKPNRRDRRITARSLATMLKKDSK